MLSRSRVSLGRLRHSPRKLGGCLHDVIASDLRKVQDRARDDLVACFLSNSSKRFPFGCSSDSSGPKSGGLRGLHSLMPNLSSMGLV